MKNQLSNSTAISICLLIQLLFKTLVSERISRFFISSYSKKGGLDFLKQRKLRCSVWKVCYYSFSFSFGLFTVLPATWFRDINQYHTKILKNISLKYTIYYYSEFSFYIGEMVSIFIDIKKKDFYQMIIHHFSTLFSIALSFKLGLFRFGVSIIFLHNITDPLLESAKIAFYLKKKKIANILFFIFAICFYFIRLFVFPFYIVFPLTKTCFGKIGQEMNIILISLNTLICLHIVWSYYILRIILRAIMTGKTKDIRSEEKED